MNPLKTAFIMQYDEYDQVNDSYIFAGDDGTAAFRFDAEEHPELGNLEKGKFYILTIESYR